MHLKEPVTLHAPRAHAWGCAAPYVVITLWDVVMTLWDVVITLWDVIITLWDSRTSPNTLTPISGHRRAVCGEEK